MQKCRNCGRETMRTEDWACQWCGYPLLSNSYKKVPKTYRQLQEEQPLSEEVPPAETDIQASIPREKPQPPRPLYRDPEPVQAIELEPATNMEFETPLPASEPAVEQGTEPQDTEPIERTSRELQAVDMPVVPVPVEASTPEAELTVEDLLNIYAKEGMAADTRLANKVLKVRGSVGRVEAKEALGIYYVNLLGMDGKTIQGVRCVFSPAKGVALAGLVTGQAVTIIGRYDGSIIDTRMKDCVLVEK